MVTVIILLFMFVVGLIAILLSFIPKDIWQQFPIQGILSGIFLNGLASGFLHSGTQNIVLSILVPLTLSIIIFCTFKYSYIRNSKDFVLGFISPFVLFFIGGFISVILTGEVFSKQFLWMNFFLVSICSILSLLFFYVMLYKWFNLYQDMKDKLDDTQIIMANLGVSLTGISLGIYIGSSFRGF